MSMWEPAPDRTPLDVIVAVDGDEVIAELDIENNARVRVGDQYTARWDDGAITIMRVTKFKSAEEYSNTIARRTDAMREGVAGTPRSKTARKAYQVKLAVLRIEGELLPDGTRRIGPSRAPDVMVPLERISDESLERFAIDATGNIILGNLRSGWRTLNRVARMRHNYAGERMVVLGMPGKGKSQLIRSLLSQSMAEEDEDLTASEGDELGARF
jgi:hypothetical protein